jgi:ElaB/YqjD/DUF883 family membrane-anchored ribosome-binding protein
MDDSGNAATPSGSSTSGATQGVKASAAIAEEERVVADRLREPAEKTSERPAMLADDARDVITENPLVSTLTVFAVGLVTGTLLGVLLSRD